MHRYITLIFLFALLLSCAPSSPEEFNAESQRLQKELVRLLKQVETIEDIHAKGPKIRVFSYELVALIERADTYYARTHTRPLLIHLPITEILRQEMGRIYDMPGGREAFEKYQREALIVLDEYQR